MVISFTDDHVFTFLRTHGYVVTFRKNRRSKQQEDTWVRRKRGEPKEFDCMIQEIGKVEDLGDTSEESEKPFLQEWVQVNGLPTDHVQDWIDVIRCLNDEVPEEGWLYLVKKKQSDTEQ